MFEQVRPLVRRRLLGHLGRIGLWCSTGVEEAGPAAVHEHPQWSLSRWRGADLGADGERLVAADAAWIGGVLVVRERPAANGRGADEGDLGRIAGHREAPGCQGRQPKCHQDAHHLANHLPSSAIPAGSITHHHTPRTLGICDRWFGRTGKPRWSGPSAPCEGTGRLAPALSPIQLSAAAEGR